MSARDQHIATDDLSAYLDGEVDERLRPAIDDHLSTCAPCRAELAELRATVRLLHALPVPAPRRSFQLGPEHARPEPPKGMLLTMLPVVRALSVAAAIALLVVSGAFLFDSTTPDRTGSIVFTETTSEQDPAAADAAPPSSNATGAGDASAPTTGESEANTSMAAAAEADEPPSTAAADADTAGQEANDGEQAKPALPSESLPAQAGDAAARDDAASSRAASGVPAESTDEANIPWGTITAWLAAATVALGGLWGTLARITRIRSRAGT